MTYYIDFDNTLFDTEKFYNDLLNVIKKYDIYEKDINLYYENNYSNEIFNPLKIIYEIIEIKNLNIMDEITFFLRDISKYLYDDTITFLKYLNKKNYKVNLLTYGNYDYQNMKVNNSSIKKYFNEIIITKKMKYELDLDYRNSIFVDDDVVQIDGLLKKQASVIRIRRKGNKHSRPEANNVLEYCDLNEYLKNMK